METLASQAMHNTPFGFVPLENSETNGNSEKIVLFSQLESSASNLVFNKRVSHVAVSRKVWVNGKQSVRPQLCPMGHLTCYDAGITSSDISIINTTIR